MIITSNNVHKVFNQRVLEIPFKGVDKKGIIESIEKSEETTRDILIDIRELLRENIKMKLDNHK